MLFRGYIIGVGVGGASDYTHAGMLQCSYIIPPVGHARWFHHTTCCRWPPCRACSGYPVGHAVVTSYPLWGMRGGFIILPAVGGPPAGHAVVTLWGMR